MHVDMLRYSRHVSHLGFQDGTNMYQATWLASGTLYRTLALFDSHVCMYTIFMYFYILLLYLHVLISLEFLCKRWLVVSLVLSVSWEVFFGYIYTLHCWQLIFVD